MRKVAVRRSRYTLSNLIAVSVIILMGIAIVGYPLVSFLHSFLNIPSRMVTLPYRASTLFISAVILLYALSTRRLLTKYAVIVPLFVFWTFYIIRIFVDVLVYQLPLSRPGWEFFAYGVGTCFIPMLALMTPLSPSMLKRALIVVWGCTLLGGILAAVNVNKISAMGRLRATDTLNPITLGHLGVTLAVLSVFIFLNYRNKLRFNVLFLAAALLGFFLVGLAASRSPVLSLVSLVPALVWIGGRTKSLRKLFFIAGALIVLMPWLIWKISSLGSRLVERVENTAETAGTEEYRLILWERSWDAFVDNPIFGYSLIPPVGNYPHNLIIESFMATGIFGGVAFSIVVLMAVYVALKLIYQRAPQAWLGLLFLQALIYASFSGAIYSHTFFWCTMGAVFSSFGTYQLLSPTSRSEEAS